MITDRILKLAKTDTNFSVQLQHEGCAWYLIAGNFAEYICEGHELSISESYALRSTIKSMVFGD